MSERIGLLLILFFCLTPIFAADNYLRSSKMVGNNLHLHFKFNLKQVDHFLIPSSGFTKYIYDVRGGVLPTGKTLSYSHPNVRAFRIGQYNKEVLRIVIESSNANRQKHKIKANKLIIPLPIGKKLYTKRKASKKTYTQKSRYNGRSVVIDPGHGGKDSGALCCSVKEKKIVLKISKKLQKKLQAKGYKVYMTRTGDKFVSLIKRTEYANIKKADIFISIHANAAPSKKRKRLNGIEVFYLRLNNSRRIQKSCIVYKGRTVYGKQAYLMMTHKKKIDQSKKLAENVYRSINYSIRKGYKYINSDLKHNDFWVLLGTKMPSVLVEAGYLTHEQDRKRLESSYYQNLLVKGIVLGVDNYFARK